MSFGRGVVGRAGVCLRAGRSIRWRSARVSESAERMLNGGVAHAAKSGHFVRAFADDFAGDGGGCAASVRRGRVR